VCNATPQKADNGFISVSTTNYYPYESLQPLTPSTRRCKLSYNLTDGGAGTITRENLPPESEAEYKSALANILQRATKRLNAGLSSLDIATTVVSELENCTLFNCGHGAVFTRAGTVELEASVMVSRGYKKRGAAASLLKHVKNPILFVKKILEHGEQDLEPEGVETAAENTSAQGHVHISGSAAETLARLWGSEMVDESYFWTRKRWEEHIRDLERQQRQSTKQEEKTPMTWAELCNTHPSTHLNDSDPAWDGHEYLPQGTVGCVVLDRDGTLCTATSTGGLTNKLPGRIGDTPTFGAGFWAEELHPAHPQPQQLSLPPLLRNLTNTLPLSLQLPQALTACLPTLQTSLTPSSARTTAVAMSGTGNGDSFLRLAACHAAAAQCAWTSYSLGDALQHVAGVGGTLQQSAGDRWNRGRGEGAGGIIGIEIRGGRGWVRYAFNCGGLFRAYVDDQGVSRVGVFRGDEF
jgi:L-asparaginase